MSTASKSYETADVTSGNLMWPSNITNGFDYLQIDILKFVPNKKGVRTATLYEQSSSSVSFPASSLDPLTGFYLGAAGITLPTTSSTATGTTTTKKSLGTVILPVPEDINYVDTPKWSDQEVGVLGKFGPQLAGAAVGGDSSAITSAVQTLAQTGKVDIALKALGRFADPNAITQNINGKIANPYVEQVFNGLGLRTFEFTWKLVPRNKKEQDSIHNIIKTLRSNALPGFSDTFGESGNAALDNELNEVETQFGENGQKLKTTDRWLTVPNIFNLRWMTNGTSIESLPKIKPCVLKNIQVSYTPDNVWATHLKDGSKNPYPVAYNLSLSFGEVEIITGSDVSKGY